MPDDLEITVTKTATLNGTDGKPAIELTTEGAAVKIVLLPKQGQRRKPVAITALRQALDALES